MAGPCCPGRPVVKRILIGGQEVGIAELDAILQKAFEMKGVCDEELKKVLLNELRIYNYVPPSADKEYLKGVWDAFVTYRQQHRAVKEDYHGIPREEIPWFPTINYELCSNCGKCYKFCHRGVYTFDDGPKVARPYRCIVSCTGCMVLCPDKAISFPTLVELRETLKVLRTKYVLKKE
ncbi:MAG: ATP-binding protein [Thermoplasmata archaeon]